MTEAETETDKNGCMGLYGGVHTDRDRYSERCQWVSVSVSVSVSVNVPLVSQQKPPLVDFIHHWPILTMS